ncbi:RDD family protein [Flagellimonas sp.]|uniref:RDD family protein n=1 Tax=Flagellimonas sp. TaxID=2058762 RepID=UPI003B50CE44
MEVEVSSDNIEYASFGHRVGALLIDILLVFIIAGILIVFVVAPLMGELKNVSKEVGGKIVAGLIFMYFFGLPILGILYRSLFECSKLQGTPGKAIIGIKVVGSDFKKISFAKALLRNFVKILSSLVIYIGYLVALGNEKCVTWHDSAANTFVIKK